MKLSAEQEQGVAMLGRVAEEGGVGLLIGEAGSGKSASLNVHRTRHPSTVVVAPGGLAAINVGGETIDRFCGWKKGENGPKRLNRRNYNRLLRSGCIVIDEGYMVRADKIDRLDRDLRLTTGDPRPFGGQGVFIMGDPFQLEPVVPKDGPEREYFDKQGYKSPYLFDSRVWESIDPQCVRLTHIFRQAGNDALRKALNQIRVGDEKGLALINTRAREIPLDGAITLCFRNEKADETNEFALSMLGGEERTYFGASTGDVGTQLPSPVELRLKIGARVMTTVNAEADFDDDPLYINGDMGYVLELRPDSVLVDLDRSGIVEITYHTWVIGESGINDQGDLFTSYEGDKARKYRQIPLRLAWAVSVHKSQGMTLDKVHIDNSGVAFAFGLVYVACSRCRTLEGMTLARPFTKWDLKVHPRVVEWYEQIKDRFPTPAELQAKALQNRPSDSNGGS